MPKGRLVNRLRKTYFQGFVWIYWVDLRMTYLSKHFAEYLSCMTPLCLYSFLTFTFCLPSQRYLRGKENFKWDNWFNDSTTLFYPPRCRIAIVNSGVLNHNATVINSYDRLKWFPKTKTESFLSTYQSIMKEFCTLERWVGMFEDMMPMLFAQNPFPTDREWSQRMHWSSVLCCPR